MAFEVVSVKLAKPGIFVQPNMFLDNGDAKPPGGMLRGNWPLLFYINFAYKLDLGQAEAMPAQLPKWARNQSWLIEAKADGNPTKDQMRLMMQSLLADRFKLRVHFETREGAVLALTLVAPGKLGPKLIPHSQGPPCPDHFEMDDLSKPPAPPTKPGVEWPPQCVDKSNSPGNVRGHLDRCPEYNPGVDCLWYWRLRVPARGIRQACCRSDRAAREVRFQAGATSRDDFSGSEATWSG